MDTLTPTLTLQQLQQNITALQKGGQQNSVIQNYVNNYKKDPTTGNFVLASSQQNQSQDQNTPGATDQNNPSPLASMGDAALNYLGLNVQQQTPQQATQQDILGAGALGQNIAQIPASFNEEAYATQLDQARGTLAQGNLKLIQQMKTVQDPAERQKMATLINQTEQQMQTMRTNADTYRNKEVTPGSIAGAALKTAGSVVLGAAGEVGDVLKTGAGTVAKMATYGLSGLQYGLGQSLANGNNDPRAIATDSIVQGITSAIAGPAIEGIAEQSTSMLKSAANKMYQYATKIGGSLADAADNSTAVQKLISDGIWGKASTILGQAIKSSSAVGQKISDILTKYDATEGSTKINPYDVFTDALDTLKKYTNGAFSTADMKTALLKIPAASLWGEDVTASLENENMAAGAEGLLKKAPEVGTAVANGIKSTLDDMTYAARQKGDLLSQQATSALADTVRSTIRDTVTTANGASEDIGKLFDSYGTYQKAVGAIGKTPIGLVAKSILPTIAAIYGQATGGTSDAIKDALITLGVQGAVGNTASLSGESVLLDRIAGFIPQIAKGSIPLMQQMAYGLAHIATQSSSSQNNQ